MRTSVKLYLAGMCLHILYLFIIWKTPSVFRDMTQCGSYALCELTEYSAPDTRSYVEPALNFMEYGIYGNQEVPDYHRTIGYPMLLSLFMALFGLHAWPYILIIFQALLAALAYPMIYQIGRRFFGNLSKTPFYTALLAMLLGLYFTRTYHIMTDLPFAVFFLLGFYFNLRSVEHRGNWISFMLGLVLISFAGLIRPMLVFYFIPAYLFLFWHARKTGSWKIFRVRLIAWISPLFLLLGCNVSSVRMFHNFGVFTPCDVLGFNMFNYSTKEILSRKQKEAEFDSLQQVLDGQSDFRAVMETEKNIFYEVIKRYPLAAVTYWTEVTLNHTLSPHWQAIGRAYGLYKRDYYNRGRLTLRKSNLMKYVYYFGLAFNLFVILIPFLFFIFDRFRTDALFVISVLLLIALMMGPTFIAGGSERMRLPVEPFMLLLAVHQLERLSGKFIRRRKEA